MLKEFKDMGVSMYVMTIHGFAVFGMFCAWAYFYAPAELCKAVLNHTIPFWR